MSENQKIIHVLEWIANKSEQRFMAKRILLADDSITIQKVVELTFSDGDYEVTAVNNGSKAISKLSEMRPDIILSDIIMPEKNGYEVCEYVKSHPEYKSIPVILLTGTFEPFDPDRADKAGCDAVVTKPFESQSLIHKVEELIENAKSQAPTDRSQALAGGELPFAAAPPPVPPPPSDQFSTGTFESQDNVFAGSAPSFSAPPPAETPFAEPPATTGETRAFPKMSFEEMSKPAEAPSPWAEAPAPAGGETRAFPKMGFEDLNKAAEPAPPAPTSGETRAFPKMTFEDVDAAPAPQPDARPSSPWDEAPSAPSGETRAFPKMSFEDLDKAAPPPEPPPAPSTPAEPLEPSWSSLPAAEPSPAPMWEEQPAFSGETKAFPKMTFEDLDKEMPPPPATPILSEPLAMPEELPPTPAPPPAAPAASASGAELSEAEVDRIARRVVQLMADTVVRNIAWEVIPDLAEMVVKERIRQLESE